MNIKKMKAVYLSIYIILGIIFFSLEYFISNFASEGRNYFLIGAILFGFISRIHIYFKKKNINQEIKITKNKVVSYLTIPALLVSIFTIGLIDSGKTAEARTIAAPASNIHSVKNITIRYSKAEAAKIANKSNSVSNFADYASFILGFKKPYMATFLYGYSKGVATTGAPFNTAKTKGTGLTISYKYTIYKNTNIGSFSNVKYTYN